MSDLESLNGFENDAGHYLAQVDRALAQLKRVLNDREMGLLYREIGEVSNGIARFGENIARYVQQEQQRVLREIDEEAHRESAALSQRSAKGQRANSRTPRFSPSDQPVSASLD